MESSRVGAEAVSLAVARRILQLKREGETDAEFGRRVGLTPQVLSNYRGRLHGASLEAVAAVAARTPVNLQWLLTGAGARETVMPAGPDPYAEGVKATTDRMLALIWSLRSQHGLRTEPPPASVGEEGLISG